MMMMMMMMMMMVMTAICIEEMFDSGDYVKPHLWLEFITEDSHQSKPLTCLKKDDLNGNLYDILGVLKKTLNKILLIFFFETIPKQPRISVMK